MATYGIIFINVMTPLHNGSGESLGIIDNPVIRERITAFPFIQSASVKGVLRDECGKEGQGNAKKIKALFGPEPGGGEEHSGAVSFGDAQLLAFPVRSLKGCFVWATSPLVLNRFHQRMNIAGMSCQSLEGLKKYLSSTLNKAIICKGSENLLLFKPDSDRKLLLEEFPINTESSEELMNFAKEINPFIFDHSETFLKDEFEKKLVLLPEDNFRYFVINTTEVVPNIRIGESGTTFRGSLRYTEYLPTESILYSLLAFEKARTSSTNPDEFKDINVDTDKKVQDLFCSIMPEIIQLGGDETTGKGLVKLKIKIREV